jgi:hypothetical protein
MAGGLVQDSRGFTGATRACSAVKRGLALPLALSALLGLASCRDSYEWRQKLTVTVETPSGERSGSSVVDVTALFGQLPLSGNEVEYAVKGEATVVEVAPGRYLFALLTHPQELAAHVWRDQLPASRKDWLPLVSHLRGARSVDPKDYPVLVTFGDISDPDSVRVVSAGDLVATFGSGFRLSDVTLEITGDEVTTGKLGPLLKWLGPYPEPSVLSKIDPHDFSPEATLRQGDFIRR